MAAPVLAGEGVLLVGRKHGVAVGFPDGRPGCRARQTGQGFAGDQDRGTNFVNIAIVAGADAANRTKCLLKSGI